MRMMMAAVAKRQHNIEKTTRSNLPSSIPLKSWP
jgi:hypothetical protein